MLWHWNPSFGIQRTLGKHCLHSAGCGSIFPAKNHQDTCRSGSQLARGQVNMADEAKHCNLICSTFEALAVPCAVGHCGGELSPFCWPMLALGIVVCGASHWFAKHTSQMQWLHWDSGSRPTADHPAMTRTFFWRKFGFEKCFGASFQSSHWDSYHWLSCKIHFCCMSQLCDHIKITCLIKKWFIAQSRNGSLLPRIREDNTLKRFFFFCQFMRHPLTEVFYFFNLLQMPNNRRMANVWFFGDFPCSCKRIEGARGSASMIFLLMTYYLLFTLYLF